MEPLEPCRRMGSHGRLLDASLLRALLLPGPGGAAALDWLERVGEGLLRVSAWSVMELEGELDGRAAQRLLDGFLAERCPGVCFEPDDLRWCATASAIGLAWPPCPFASAPACLSPGPVASNPRSGSG